MPVSPSSNVPPAIAYCSDMQAAGRPRRQSGHSRHEGAHDSTTSSPGASAANTLANRLDDARALVAEHHRRGPLPLALDHVQVGAADAAGRHPHEHLARAWLVELDLADLERPSLLVEDGRAGDHSSAAFTSEQLVTLATFWSA